LEDYWKRGTKARLLRARKQNGKRKRRK
jgi:hypothetical protein